VRPTPGSTTSDRWRQKRDDADDGAAEEARKAEVGAAGRDVMTDNGNRSLAIVAGGS
jgi:hypothetical protein